MKVFTVVLCSMLLVFGVAGISNALPISQGESYSWSFDTSSLSGIGSVSSVRIMGQFPFDMLTPGESMRWDVLNELSDSTPLASHTYVANVSTTSGMTDDFSTTPFTFDDDLYVSLTMITGSLDLMYFRLYGYNTDTDLIEIPYISGTLVETSPVPEPCTILLLGTGLVGLVGFRKKFKK